jgi:hypothetical protein
MSPSGRNEAEHREVLDVPVHCVVKSHVKIGIICDAMVRVALIAVTQSAFLEVENKIPRDQRNDAP